MNRSPRTPKKRTPKRIRIVALSAGAAVLIAVSGFAVAGALGTERAGDGHSTPEPGSVEAVAEELAAGQARDRAELNGHLAEAAEVAHGHLTQVLQELASAVPVHEADGSKPASADDVDEWQRDLVLATSALEAVEEGTSEQTVAREAFIGSAQLLQSAAAGYDQVLSAPDNERDALAVTVAERRDAAVRLWQAGAAQLDTLVVEAGEGHVHLFLAPNGDPEAVPEEFREPENPAE